jgi:uncharacterized protein (UPF0332 family)
MTILSDYSQNLEWCKSKGLKNVPLSAEIAQEYLKSAEETMRMIDLIKDSGSNMWLATLKYYAEYFLAYALLRRFGIKSDIHECTIKVITAFEKIGIIKFNFSKILQNDKDLRADNQYYLKNIKVNLDVK